MRKSDHLERLRLLREAREDDARMVPAPWTARVHGSMGPDHFVLTRSDGDYDLLEKDDALAIARTRSNLRAMADQLEAALAEIDRLTVARNADRTEWMTTYATMRAEIKALRCGDLGPYFGGRLSAERAAAFQLHLATCAACAAGLLDLMQLEASLTTRPR
jgi:hypothetical protein